MAIVRVHALKNLTIIDPTPLEGTSKVVLQQLQGTTKDYTMYDHQADRMQGFLNSAVAVGMCTYTISWSTGVGSDYHDTYMEFDHVDLSRKICDLMIGIILKQITVNVVTPFDGNAKIKIGLTSARAKYVSVTDVDLSVVGAYKIDIDTRISPSEELYLFLEGTPTMGAGEIFVYTAKV
jgi:hypothetical protein